MPNNPAWNHFIPLLLLTVFSRNQIHTQVPGGLDTDFGQSGFVLANFSADDKAQCIALQADGKIIVGGTSKSNGQSTNVGNLLTLLRYNPDGTPDSSFGTEGKVFTDIDNLTYPNKEIFNAIAIQPDGKIVAGGYAQYFGSYHAVLARYLPDGTPDDSFGDEGVIVFDNRAGIEALVLQPDGKILAAGYEEKFFDQLKIMAARFLPDGQFDPEFGTDGRVIYDIPSFLDEKGTGVLLQESGDFLVACAASNAGFGGGVGQLATVHFWENGAPDTIAGQHIYDFKGVNFKAKMQQDGKMLFAGGSEFQVLRVLENGDIDMNFGNAGRAFFPQYNTVNDLIIQPDGKIIAAGSVNNLFSDYALVRYDRFGQTDPNFGYQGLAQANANQQYCTQVINAIALQPDGKIVGAGTLGCISVGNYDISLVRFWAYLGETTPTNGQPSVADSPVLKLGANPVSDRLACKLTLSAPQPVRFELMDIQGRLLGSWNFEEPVSGENNFDIDLPNTVSAGLYLLRFRTAGYSQTERLVKI